MNRFASSVKRFLVSELGPTAVEYAVMVALIIVLCSVSVRAVGLTSIMTFMNISVAAGGGGGGGGIRGGGSGS